MQRIIYILQLMFEESTAIRVTFPLPTQYNVDNQENLHVLVSTYVGWGKGLAR